MFFAIIVKVKDLLNSKIVISLLPAITVIIINYFPKEPIAFQLYSLPKSRLNKHNRSFIKAQIMYECFTTNNQCLVKSVFAYNIAIYTHLEQVSALGQGTYLYF